VGDFAGLMMVLVAIKCARSFAALLARVKESNQPGINKSGWSAI
jgi:hypothetical protein